MTATKMAFLVLQLIVVGVMAEQETVREKRSTTDETASCLASSLTNFVNTVDRIESAQQQIKQQLTANASALKAEIQKLSSKVCELETLQPTKEAPVAALVHNCLPLLIQQHNNGTNAFNRSWEEYKVGFNDSAGNYWLGNDILSELTLTGRYKLRIDLQPRSNLTNWYFAEYTTFTVQPESSNYTLHLTGYSGTTGRVSPFWYVEGHKFSTYDRDNDLWTGNCAAHYGGGFWMNWCHYVCLNCYHEFFWTGLTGGDKFLKTSRMWLLCK